MAVHTFQVIMPVDTLLPRDAYVNTFHMDHVGGPFTDVNANALADAVVDLWQSHYGSVTGEVRCKIYETPTTGKAGPPLANRVKALGNYWSSNKPRETALCLSYAANKSIPSQRGRMYLAPNLKIGGAFTIAQRPGTDVMSWALAFFSESNNSLPDLGGVDWKFGIWSPSQGAFHQAQTAWCDNEWDTVRSRGLRATDRVSATREG